MSLTRNNFHHSTRVACNSPFPTSSISVSQVPVESLVRGNSWERVSCQHGESESFKTKLSSQYIAFAPKTSRNHSVVEDRHYSLCHYDDVFTKQKAQTSHHVGNLVDSQLSQMDTLDPFGYPYRDPHYEPREKKRSNSSPTTSSTHSSHTSIDNSSVQGSSRGRNGMRCTYRNFSLVPPSKKDLERHKEKKYEYVTREKSLSDASGGNTSTAIKLELLAVQKRGRGNIKGKRLTNSFVGFKGTNFPARLHDLLSHESGINDAITWLPHGRSWIVRDKQKFLEEVAPSHFQISKFESFTRQVNGWGFKRITKGPDMNSYYHELFLRGMPHLIQWMKRLPSGKRKPSAAEAEDEPDFHSIESMFPIPDYYSENEGWIMPKVPYQYQHPTSETHKIPAKRSLCFASLESDNNISQCQSDPQNLNCPFVDHFESPLSPKKFRPNDCNFIQFRKPEHKSSTDYSWYQTPQRNAFNSSQREDVSQKSEQSKGPSKVHWQAFCEALLEDEENNQNSIYRDQSDVPVCQLLDSIDFEPHSIHEFIPSVDSILIDNNTSYNQGYHDICSYLTNASLCEENPAKMSMYPKKSREEDSSDQYHHGGRERKTERIYPEFLHKNHDLDFA